MTCDYNGDTPMFIATTCLKIAILAPLALRSLEYRGYFDLHMAYLAHAIKGIRR